MREDAEMHAVPSLPDASVWDDADKLDCRHTVRRGNSGPTTDRWTGGHIVVGTANCNGLEPKSEHAEQLLGNRRYFKQFPDIWAFTEVDGRSGTVDLRTSLGPKMCKLYDIYWSLRSVDHTGKPVLAGRRGRMGGGVALLVRKSLNLQARSFVVPLSHDDMQLARGHILSLRLDPKPVPQGQGARPWWPQRSCVVTVAYVPPLQVGEQAKWGSAAVRDVLLGVLNSTHKAIQRLRVSDDVFPITLAHLNSPDNACAVPLVLRQPLPCDQVVDALSLVAGDKCVGTSGTILLNGSSQLILQRRSCSAAQVAAANAIGRPVMVAAAECGIVPLDGVVRHREPTSFTKRNCRMCGSAQDCRCFGRPSLVLRAVHDFILASADCVWDAFIGSHPLKYYINLRSRLCPQAGNRSWAPGIDHCVTSCRLFVGPGATQSSVGGVAPRSVPMQCKRVGRYRLPENLAHRNLVLQAAAGESDVQLCNRFSLLACNDDDTVWQDSDEMASRIQLALVRSRAVAEAKKQEMTKSGPSMPTSRQKHLWIAKKEMERARAAKQEVLRMRIDAEGSLHADRKRQRETAHVTRIKAHLALSAVRSSSDGVASAGSASAGDDSVHVKQRLQAASKRFKEAKIRFKREIRQRHSWLVRWARPRAPALSWKLLKSFAHDDGLPGDGAAKLLQHLTDDRGSTIANTRDDIIARLLQHQRQVFQVEPTLPDDAENRLVDACVVVSAFNCGLQQDMPHLHADSAVAQAAADPLVTCRSWQTFDARRGRLLENLSARLASCNAARLAGSGAFARHNAVLQKHSGACAALQVPFEVSEVVKAMSRVRDGGAGVDRVEPALLMGHDRVHDCADCARAQLAMSGAVGALSTDCHAAEALTRLFNANHRQGRLPIEWRCHRCLLHYKGKGSDPHCVDNYRGLGVDQALLKLFSLVMEERLMTFVEATGALSHTQGGFLRQRGTPEQVITLSEVVRSALKRNRKVYLEFLDIRRAYDTVLHPVLWQRCIDIGIGGPFLALLQEIYFKAEARLDIDGTLLAAVPLECGVLQGNPLSPLLFNIYLDGAVREFEERVKNYQRTGASDEPPLGLSFPRRPPDGVLRELAPARLGQDDWIACADALDRLTHLFYADDGVLMAHSREQLQMMSDWICELFGSLGLRVNARKTKCMLVLPGSWSSEGQQRVFADAHANQIRVGADLVDWVPEFDYLGVRFNYRWTWQSAWKEAARRATVAYHRACGSGWDERGTLDSLLAYAQGKIFCHFTYIAAITGCGGRKASKYSDMAVAVQKRVMRHIGGYEFADADIVMAEAGVWDLQSSIDMWLLRFWCKVSCSSHDSMAYRAMLLSLRTSTAVSVSNVDTLYVNEKQIYCQSWAQHLIAAAARFDLDTDLVRQMRLSAVLLVQVQLPSATGPTWSRDFDPSDFTLVNLLEMQQIFHANLDVPPSKMRLVATGDGRVRSAGTNCWLVPGTDPSVRLTNVLRRWTTTLKVACYSALRRRGNACRQSLVRIRRMQHVQNRSSHFWWAVFSAGSIRQPYWWATNTFAARRLLRLRACQACNEGYIRQRPYTQVISKDLEITLPRINDRCLRACYMCHPIDAAVAPDVYWPDTVEHMLITCLNARLVEVRERLRRQLTDLAAGYSSSAAAAPDFSHDTALLTAFMLASGTGPMPTMESIPVVTGTPVQRRDGPQINFDPAVARSTSAWIAALTDPWVSSHRTPRGAENPDGLPGGQLVSAVLNAVAQIFTVHNHVCRSKSNDGFRLRARDPVPNRARPSHAAARRARRAARKVAQTVQRRRRRTLLPMPRPPRCRKLRGGNSLTRVSVEASWASIDNCKISDFAAGSDPPDGVDSATRDFPPVARPPSDISSGGSTSVGAVVDSQCNCNLLGSAVSNVPCACANLL